MDFTEAQLQERANEMSEAIKRTYHEDANVDVDRMAKAMGFEVTKSEELGLAQVSNCVVVRMPHILHLQKHRIREPQGRHRRHLPTFVYGDVRKQLLQLGGKAMWPAVGVSKPP